MSRSKKDGRAGGSHRSFSNRIGKDWGGRSRKRTASKAAPQRATRREVLLALKAVLAEHGPALDWLAAQ